MLKEIKTNKISNGRKVHGPGWTNLTTVNSLTILIINALLQKGNQYQDTFINLEDFHLTHKQNIPHA